MEEKIRNKMFYEASYTYREADRVCVFHQKETVVIFLSHKLIF